MSDNKTPREGQHVYLGDGVYVQQDKVVGDLVLYTHDGLRITNKIYLDRTIAAGLHAYMKKVGIIS